MSAFFLFQFAMFILAVLPLPIILHMATANRGSTPYLNADAQRNLGHQLLGAIAVMVFFIEVIKLLLGTLGPVTSLFDLLEVANIVILGMLAANLLTAATNIEAETAAVLDAEQYFHSEIEGELALSNLERGPRKTELQRLYRLKKDRLL